MIIDQSARAHKATKRVIRPGDSFRLTVHAMPGCWLAVIEVEDDLVRAESGSGGQSMWSVSGLMSGYSGSLKVEWRK